jgi:amidase
LGKATIGVAEMARLADELAYQGVAEIAGRIRRKELSPVEVIEAFLQRIEERNPSINALTFVDADGAMQRPGRPSDRSWLGTSSGRCMACPGS